MNTVAFVFARAGSKGLPGKNLLKLRGKPMIAWAIEQAKAVGCITRVIVSTDSEEIATIARSFGAETPFLRPTDLASDDSSEWSAWQHALNYLLREEGQLPDVMVSVPATAPLRISDDIERCIEEFNRSKADIVVTVSESHRSPYFNMVQRQMDGTVKLVIPPSDNISRRQDVPLTYDMATVAYVACPLFVLNTTGIFEGIVRSITVPPERAVDIDTLFDFRLAEYLMSAQHSDDS